MRKAFTLAEVLIMLVIIGTIIVSSIPMIKSSLEGIRKKQYIVAYKVAQAISQDAVLNFSVFNTGFLNNNSAGYCTEFAKRVNRIGALNPNCAASAIPNTPNFITTNGLRWFSLESAFVASRLTIYADVDGPNKGTNTVGDDILRIRVTDQAIVFAPLNSKECTYLGGNASGHCI